MIGIGIARICSWGSLYPSFPLVAQAMGRDTGWDKGALYFATLGLAVTGLCTYPAGTAIDRGSGQAIMSGGCHPVVAGGEPAGVRSRPRRLWSCGVAFGAPTASSPSCVASPCRKC